MHYTVPAMLQWSPEELLTQLDETPVLGVSMGGLRMLRLDRQGGSAPGNKWFKLQGNLEEAQRQGVRRLVSFGGAWSNHLHALAAVGRERGYETVGIVRGDDGMPDTPMLADARAWGMRIVPVSRGEYRRRNEPEYMESIRREFAPCLLLPEGGANALGARGCVPIGQGLQAACPTLRRVVLAVGTGTTMAGLIAGLNPGCEVVGVSALKGAADLEQRVERALVACQPVESPSWRILHNYHCGGFARVSDELREFILAFERAHPVPLDPVYTAKALYALHCELRDRGRDFAESTVFVHTGGLQGRRGFPFLCP